MNNGLIKSVILRVVSGISGLMFLVACTPTALVLTPEGEVVGLLKNPEEFPQCIFIDEMRAVSLAGGVNSYQQALVKIRNKVAAYRGTHFNIRSSDTTDLITKIEGDAYRCPLAKDGQIQEMRIDPKFRSDQ